MPLDVWAREPGVYRHGRADTWADSRVASTTPCQVIPDQVQVYGVSSAALRMPPRSSRCRTDPVEPQLDGVPDPAPEGPGCAGHNHWPAIDTPQGGPVTVRAIHSAATTRPSL